MSRQLPTNVERVVSGDLTAVEPIFHSMWWPHRRGWSSSDPARDYERFPPGMRRVRCGAVLGDASVVGLPHAEKIGRPCSRCWPDGLDADPRINWSRRP